VYGAVGAPAGNTVAWGLTRPKSGSVLNALVYTQLLKKLSFYISLYHSLRCEALFKCFFFVGEIIFESSAIVKKNPLFIIRINPYLIRLIIFVHTQIINSLREFGSIIVDVVQLQTNDFG